LTGPAVRFTTVKSVAAPMAMVVGFVRQEKARNN
jgi:hypothetical protein